MEWMRINELAHVPGPASIHVWLFDLDSHQIQKSGNENSLSEDEINRGKEFKFERDCFLFSARRSLLRRLLSCYTGIPPAEIAYHTNPNGKLTLQSGKIAFNHSKSQSKLAVAITAAAQVGVDLEVIRPLKELPQLLDFCLTEEERVTYSILPAENQLEAFYHAWTQKEAYLKAKGVGITAGMKSILVSVAPHEACTKLHSPVEDVSGWKMECATPFPGCRLTVCAQMNTEPEVEYFYEEGKSAP